MMGMGAPMMMPSGPPENPGSDKMCFEYLNTGKCSRFNRGDNCRFKHPRPGDPEAIEDAKKRGRDSDIGGVGGAGGAPPPAGMVMVQPPMMVMQPPIMDTPWRETVDPNTGAPYYYHIETKEVRWEKPAEMMGHFPPPPPVPGAPGGYSDGESSAKRARMDGFEGGLDLGGAIEFAKAAAAKAAGAPSAMFAPPGYGMAPGMPMMMGGPMMGGMGPMGGMGVPRGGPPPNPGSDKLCFQFLNTGKCDRFNRGENCRFRHPPADDPEAIADAKARGRDVVVPAAAAGGPSSGGDMMLFTSQQAAAMQPMMYAPPAAYGGGGGGGGGQPVTTEPPLNPDSDKLCFEFLNSGKCSRHQSGGNCRFKHPPADDPAAIEDRKRRQGN